MEMNPYQSPGAYASEPKEEKGLPPVIVVGGIFIFAILAIAATFLVVAYTADWVWSGGAH